MLEGSGGFVMEISPAKSYLLRRWLIHLGSIFKAACNISFTLHEGFCWVFEWAGYSLAQIKKKKKKNLLIHIIALRSAYEYQELDRDWNSINSLSQGEQKFHL